MFSRFRILVAAGVLLVPACTTQPGPKETGGALAGAAVGGLAGSQLGRGSGSAATTGLGVLLGAIVGSEVGKSLDRADQLAMEHTTRSSLEQGRIGRSSEWRNPETGHFGTVTPTRGFTNAQGTYCREFQQSVTIGGRTQQAYGAACRQPDGSWKIAS